MQKLILFFFLGINNITAQTNFNKQPNVFNEFIKKPAIEWAAYLNDTLRFTKINLSELLRKRLHNNEIKASLTSTEPGFANKIIYRNEDYINAKKLSQGSLSRINDSSKSTGEAVSNTFNLIFLNQVIYIENKKLYSYISWASPQLFYYTSSGHFIGKTDYFNTCFNFKYNFKSSVSDKVIFLGTTNRKLNTDSMQEIEMLKELYDKNLIEAIWADLSSPKIELTDLITGNKISSNDLDSLSVLPNIALPVYDSLGNVTAKLYHEPISPSSVKKIEITQSWFYNLTKNIITSNIDKLIFFAEKITEPTKPAELMPFLKIIYK